MISHLYPVSKYKIPVLPSVSFNIYDCFSGIKQEELEVHAQSESYDITEITGTWCDNSHDWRIAIVIGCFIMTGREEESHSMLRRTLNV